MNATARVKVELEVTSTGTWGKQCTIAQVQKQATETTLNKIYQAIKKDSDIRAIGAPKVTIIMLEDQ